MAKRAGAAGAAVACAAALTLGAGAAVAAPRVALEAGSTLRVNGEPGQGGVAGSVSVLWPFEGRFAFGAVVYADDLGTGLTELYDPNTGASLGTVSGQHRWSYGAGWRTEARLFESRRWHMVWGADFGYGRQETDVRGEVDGAVSGVLAATGPTLLWNAVAGHSFGVAAAWKHAFVNREADPGRTTDWAVLAFAWRWQLSRGQ